jgi:hypothetical protein
MFKNYERIERIRPVWAALMALMGFAGGAGVSGSGDGGAGGRTTCRWEARAAHSAQVARATWAAAGGAHWQRGQRGRLRGRGKGR